MKTTTLLFAVLSLSVLTSCADFKPKKIKSTKNMNLDAKSAPIDGYNYYALPPSAPQMKREQSARNTLPTKPADAKPTKKPKAVKK